MAAGTMNGLTKDKAAKNGKGHGAGPMGPPAPVPVTDPPPLYLTPSLLTALANAAKMAAVNAGKKVDMEMWIGLARAAEKGVTCLNTRAREKAARRAKAEDMAAQARRAVR